MLSAIASARRNIKLESYIFADDEIGWRFAEALAERARNGVEVRVLMDATASLFWSSRRLGRYMHNQGVHLRYFHRWSWRSPFRYNRRDHRKMLIVDEKQLFLGGFNIHRESSLLVYGEERWRDTHLGISGDLAAEASKLYDAFWHGKLDRMPKMVSKVSALIPNNTPLCRQPLHCLYMDGFQRAKTSIYLTTPYFVPDYRTMQALMAAAAAVLTAVSWCLGRAMYGLPSGPLVHPMQTFLEPGCVFMNISQGCCMQKRPWWMPHGP